VHPIVHFRFMREKSGNSPRLHSTLAVLFMEETSGFDLVGNYVLIMKVIKVVILGNNGNTAEFECLFFFI
jgi:hypothetical protein